MTSNFWFHPVVAGTQIHAAAATASHWWGTKLQTLGLPHVKVPGTPLESAGMVPVRGLTCWLSPAWWFVGLWCWLFELSSCFYICILWADDLNAHNLDVCTVLASVWWQKWWWWLCACWVDGNISKCIHYHVLALWCQLCAKKKNEWCLKHHHESVSA